MLESAQIRPSDETANILDSLGTAPLEGSQNAARILRRPEISFADLVRILSPADRERLSNVPPEIVEQLEIQARYEGYLRRQTAEIRHQRATETLSIPAGFDYTGLQGLTYEAKDKLTRLRPATVGQASRVPGVSPADISVLLVYLHRASTSGSGVSALRDEPSPVE